MSKTKSHSSGFHFSAFLITHFLVPLCTPRELSSLVPQKPCHWQVTVSVLLWKSEYMPGRGGVVGDILTLEVYLSTILKLLKIKHWRKKNYIPTFNKNIVFIFKWMLILHFSSQPICLVFYFWIIGLNCCLCKLFITCIFIFCTRLWKWCKHRLKM